MNMWKRIGLLLIVLSVALNVGVAGVWGLHVAWGYHRSPRPAREGDVDGIWSPLHRSLGVTDAQWKLLEPELIQFQRNATAICEEISLRRDALIDLIAMSDPDREAIAAMQEEIRQGQKRMQILVIDQLLAEKDILTVRQKEELFDMMRQRSGCGARGLFRHELPIRREDGS